MNWFDRYRARGMAAIPLGISVGSLALPLLAWALVTYGWRPVSIASGILVLAVGLPIARLLRREPEALGLRPDGDVGEAPTPAPVPQTLGRRRLAGGALRTRAFWLISAGHAAALAIMSGVGVHFVVYVTEVLGVSITTAATLVAVMTAAVLHGLAWGVRGPLMGAMRADYFGRRAFASVMGFSSLVVMFGSVAGPLIIGLVADGTGSYAGAFVALAVVGALGAVAFFALGRPDAAPPASPPTVAS